jgi:hypothetical protein
MFHPMKLYISHSFSDSHAPSLCGPVSSFVTLLNHGKLYLLNNSKRCGHHLETREESYD